ncbi:MAG TPA: Ig-like domain-containing protein, partial [Longimicrobiaceae bacterium]
MRFPHLLLSVFVLGAGLAACDSPSGSNTGPAARLDVVSGDAQQAVVGHELAQPLVVRVLDAKGKPVEGQLVNFRVVAGGGSVFAGSALTNSDGEARERWTLGTTTADSQKVEARAVDASSGSALVFGTFRATALADAPAAVQPAGTASFTGSAAAALADSVAARVVDKYGNPVPNSAVTWQVTAGGGTVSPATSTTGPTGIARAQWTLGPLLNSAQQLQARSGTLPAAAFSATATLAGGTTLVGTLTGDNQTAAVGQVLAQPLGLTIKLSDGKPLVGAKVVWSLILPTGDSLTTYTDAQGFTSATANVGPIAQTWTYTARVEGAATFTWHATATPGPAAKIMAGNYGVVFNLRNTYPGTQFTIWLQVGDSYDNPVSGVPVSWSVAAGTGTVSPASSVTGADGKAQATWTIGAYDPNNSANSARGTVSGVGSVGYTAGYTKHLYTTVITPTSPDPLVVAAGSSVQLGLSITDETGAAYTPTGQTWTWTSSNTNVATFPT